uniref:Uncharacterized protein n=1 Tax=Timema tahoe TaxID=61484 RepID=A0A7R9INR8_9NEOP|nr:unnamed protein product [Timema tahoe]
MAQIFMVEGVAQP